MTSLKRLIRTTPRVSISSEWADESPNMDDARGDMSHWKVTLRRAGRQLTTYFSMGSAHTGEPDAAGVMSCLLSDASGVRNTRDFADWCAEYGYDTDSRRAEKTFHACQRGAESLRRFLADDYETFMSADNDV